MKIKITQSTVCGGKFAKKGSTVDASESDARILIRLGKATTLKAEKPSDK